MTRRRKILFLSLCLVGALIIGVAIGLAMIIRNPKLLVTILKPNHVVNDPNNPIIKSYLLAERLPFKAATNITPPVKEWDTTLLIYGTQSLRLKATGWIGGEFVCQFSDEQSPRIIGHPGDYVYPCDLRFNRSANRVYAKASGLAGGLYQDTIIYEFDLSSRKTTTSIHVNPYILPADPIF